eukprot:scaffold8.g1510.t1
MRHDGGSAPCAALPPPAHRAIPPCRANHAGRCWPCPAEAETLQQRAERRRGREAVDAHQAAAAKWEEVLRLLGQTPAATAAATAVDAHFSLAESLQNWGEAILDVCSSLPDEELSPAVEAAAADQAAALFRRAVEEYGRVQDGGRQRVDAAVDAANTLCAWAEVERGRGAPAAALPLLEAAEAHYRTALGQEEDALTLSNYADSLVQRAEVCCEAGRGAAAGELYAAAAAAYDQACQLSSSDQGDDLPGLLVNWAHGLLSMAAHAAEPAQAQALLDDAAARLRRAAEFERGDPAPLTALGEVGMARAERLAAAGGGDPAAVQQAQAAIVAALEEGYQAALRIRQTEADALVGVAECHVELARLAVSGGGAEAAQRHWQEAAAAYSRALQQPAALGRWRERQDVRYNCACCLARAGRPAEAAALVRGLVATGAVTASDVAADADLAGVGSVRDGPEPPSSSSQLQQLDPDVWRLKPAWCQPWSIVASGAAVVAGVYVASDHSPGWAGASAVPVALWWYLFLGVMPAQFREYATSVNEQQRRLWEEQQRALERQQPERGVE